MPAAEYKRLQGQDADPNDDCRSEASVAESVGSERVLNHPPDRHDIWNQPWWLFLLMVLLFLGLVAASIGVHAAVCSTKSTVGDPVTEAGFTKLVIREQISTMYIGPNVNTTLCAIPRFSVDGVGPAWIQASDTVTMSNLNFGLGERVLVSISNTLRASTDFGVQSILGEMQTIGTGKIRLVDVPQADLLLAQLSAGTATIEAQKGFYRGRGLSIPMIVEGSLPEISSDFNTDLIGAIDKANDVVFLLQDACMRTRHVNESQNLCEECLENVQGRSLSTITDIEFGAISTNNHFEHHMHTFLVEPGVPIRLRVFNSASGTNFFLNITSDDIFVQSQIVAIDGHWIAPADINTLTDPIWVGVGQRMDILLFVPNRRWTSINILAVEEGEKFGRQTGISLQTDRSMTSSKDDPPRVRPSSLYKSWGNEHSFRKPIIKTGYDAEFEMDLATGSTDQSVAQSGVIQQSMKAGDINAVLLLADDNSINGRHGSPGSNATTINVMFGNQVIITLANNATQALPMRIYGHTFVITRLSGIPVDAGIERDTILIPPRENVTISFTALNPGSFPIACMNDFRRAKGMIAYLEYII